MKKGAAGKTIHRKDYQPWSWILESVELHFDIHADHTLVRSRMLVERNPDGLPSGGIELDGKELELVSLLVDGETLKDDEYTIRGERLKIHRIPKSCVIQVEVRIHPADNTALEGLYASGEFLMTQCEAEGFRKITWFPDRPDVMTRYSVTIEADRDRYPVLLSNGNCVQAEDTGNNRHRVRWEDPHPKPSYLFALVAGDLAHIEDRFTTRSGREVTLRVFVEDENIDRCDHAMESLINAMHWDEQRFDLEYDLDIYNIVATNDFNMGAMENKSLNIFNSKYVLARPDTATDADYQGIEGVIAHEYFHNWTGNRVTCRDWFQLTLKEGLTVFRDEEFSSDMQSRAVKRIQDIRALRNTQFAEDAGPMSHPIRPDQYIEINNFYTLTVYRKGAAVIRMVHTLLGEQGFQQGMKLYFQRHDGQAVTCDDFLAAMADANDRDLTHFSLWYSQSGTPVVSISARYDAQRQEYSLRVSQQTPPTQDQAEKQPLLIPFALGLLGADGGELPVQLAGEGKPQQGTRLLLLESAEQEFTFINLPSMPVPSLFRDFSAPVKINYDYSVQELVSLMAHDPEPFSRWEAAQRLAQNAIIEQVDRNRAGNRMELDARLLPAFQGLLSDREADPALLAEALIMPSEDYLGEQMDVVDVDGIHHARQFIRKALARELEPLLLERFNELNDGQAYEKSPAAMARRSLKGVCLSYLAFTGNGESLTKNLLDSSDNMTETLAAILAMMFAHLPAAGEALRKFEKRWKDDALVMDKWFALQAAQPGAGTLERVKALTSHPSFSIRNPNKVRSLIGVFAMANPTGFHAADGAGYRFHADQVIALNAINPQIASRMAFAFNRWNRYDENRQILMKTELARIAAVDGLSPDVYEIVSKALQQK
jgi:aminopeptidase N